ncbi:hypothetical protein P9112_010860 [Eukaryota sp. TZLM1-RC]
MSVPPSQSTDFLKIIMQKHDRDAFSKHTSTGKVVKTNKDEDSGSRPPSTPPQGKLVESGTEPLPASSKSKIMEPGSEPPPISSRSNHPQKISRTGTPSSPKSTTVGSSSKVSSVLKGYEELQPALDELEDEVKKLRQQIMKDAETHLEPTDYCLFEQLPPLWMQIPKKGRKVGFQTL